MPTTGIPRSPADFMEVPGEDAGDRRHTRELLVQPVLHGKIRDERHGRWNPPVFWRFLAVIGGGFSELGRLSVLGPGRASGR